MSKKEGDILRNYLKANGISISKFATDMGFSGRTGLYYQLEKDFLDQELKNRAAAVLGVDAAQIFSVQKNRDPSDQDKEKEALRDLVEAQKEIIKNFRQFVTAQLIRNEAFASETLYQLAQQRLLIDPKKKGVLVDDEAAEYERGVEGRIKGIQDALGL